MLSLSCPRAVSWDSALPLSFPAHRPLEAVSMACRDASGPQPDIWELWPAWGRGCSPSGADGAPTHPLPPGLLWQLRPSDVEVELLAHTRQVVSRELEEETGLHTGWIQNGGLFIASSRQRLDEYKRLMSVGAPPRAGVGSVVQGRSPGGCGWSLALPQLGWAPCDRRLCLRASAFSPLKWDPVEEHGSAEPQRQKRPSGWGLPPRAVLLGVRLKDEPAQPGRQGPLFPQLCRRCLGNIVVREMAEEALHRGRPAVGVECWSFTQSSQGWPPHSRAWKGRVSPAMHRLPSTNCILASRTGGVGSGGALSRGRCVPLSAPAEAAAAGFVTAGRGISGVRRRSRSASSHHLFPTLLTHQLGRVTLGGFSSSSERGLCHLSVRMRREGI